MEFASMPTIIPFLLAKNADSAATKNPITVPIIRLITIDDSYFISAKSSSIF